MKIKTIYLLRHGETDFNKRGMVQGKGVDASLNELGREQAVAVSEHFQRIPLDKVYTSSLIRTFETVQPLLSNGLKETKLAGFDEISWGDQEGVVPDEHAKNLYWDTVKAWRTGELHRQVGGGETPVQVMERQKEAIETVLSGPEEDILICFHGRAMRILLCWVLNYPLNYMDGFPHQNCSYYTLRYDGSTFFVKDFNQTNHLNG